MRSSPRREHGKWIGRLQLLVGTLVISFGMAPEQRVFPESQSLKQQARADVGKSLFNGKGACYYCHGVDGYRNAMPQVEADMAALIGRLNPPPSDLRNAKGIKLKTDKARAKIIREGHEGTGMFPDTTLSDQEIVDTVAYLALLRREGGSTSRETRRP